MLAAEQGDEAVVKVLLEYGANPNKGRTDCNSAALEGAAVKGHLGIMQLLLHYKAKVRTSFFSFFLSFFPFSFLPSFFWGDLEDIGMERETARSVTSSASSLKSVARVHCTNNILRNSGMSTAVHPQNQIRR